jgi:ABC-type multidrug transport system fused ATPase/permease subunit
MAVRVGFDNHHERSSGGRYRSECVNVVSQSLCIDFNPGQHGKDYMADPDRTGYTAGMAPIVELRDAGVAINGRALLDRVSFRVEPAETIVLLGRSGSGKTTTLRLINRLLEPTSGEVAVEGKKTTDWDPIRLRRRIGYVIQEIGLFPHFTVARNVALVPSLESWPEAQIARRVEEMLALVGWSRRVSHRDIRVSFREASGSGSASRGRWRPIRRFCCWTNRSARWTRSRERSCRKSFERFKSGSAKRWSL